MSTPRPCRPLTRRAVRAFLDLVPAGRHAGRRSEVRRAARARSLRRAAVSRRGAVLCPPALSLPLADTTPRPPNGLVAPSHAAAPRSCERRRVGPRPPCPHRDSSSRTPAHRRHCDHTTTSSSGSGAGGRRARLLPNATRRNWLDASALRGLAGRREQPRECRPSALTIGEPCTRARAVGGALLAGRRHTRAFRGAGRAPREPPPERRTEDVVRRGTRARQSGTEGRRARPRTRSATSVMRLRVR
jgi:hypothetical protein